MHEWLVKTNFCIFSEKMEGQKSNFASERKKISKPFLYLLAVGSEDELKAAWKKTHQCENQLQLLISALLL